MSNIKTELKALWQLTKFFGSVFGLMALTWVSIVVAWAVFE
jgi:hypothetical protein